MMTRKMWKKESIYDDLFRISKLGLSIDLHLWPDI